MLVELYWVPIGFGVVALLLILLLARLVGNSKRREIRKKLGLPVDSRLTPEQSQAFMALREHGHEAQEVVSDDVGHAAAGDGARGLRDKGVLPKKKQAK